MIWYEKAMFSRLKFDYLVIDIEFIWLCFVAKCVVVFCTFKEKKKKKTIIKMCRVDKIGFSKFRWLIPIFVLNVYEKFKLELAKYCDVWILKKKLLRKQNRLIFVFIFKMVEKRNNLISNRNVVIVVEKMQ